MAFEFGEGGKRMICGIGGLEVWRREGDVVDCDGGRGSAARGMLFVLYSLLGCWYPHLPHQPCLVSAGLRPSQSRQSLGKLSAERSNIVVMAASQALVIGRLA
jgi:hypothetical protein